MVHWQGGACSLLNMALIHATLGLPLSTYPASNSVVMPFAVPDELQNIGLALGLELPRPDTYAWYMQAEEQRYFIESVYEEAFERHGQLHASAGSSMEPMPRIVQWMGSEAIRLGL